MSTTTVVAQRSPTDASSTSPGFQGSPLSTPNERPASAEMEDPVAPLAEIVEDKDLKVSKEAARDGDTADAGGNTAGSGEDATPSNEVRVCRA